MASSQRLLLLVAALAAASWLAAVASLRGRTRELVRLEAAAALAKAEARIQALEERMESLERQRGIAGAPEGGAAVVQAPRRTSEAAAVAPSGHVQDLWDRMAQHLMEDWAKDWWDYQDAPLLPKAAIGATSDILDAMKGNWSVAAFNRVFAAAAFGDLLLTPFANKTNNLADFLRDMKLFLKQRTRFVKALFSHTSLQPNMAFIDLAFGKVLSGEITGNEQMLSVVAWGAFRGAIAKFSKTNGTCTKLQFGLDDFVDDQEEAGVTGGELSYAPNVFQYIWKHMQVLREKSSDGETILMELARNESAECCNVIADLMYSYVVPLSDMNGNGETAAMLALLHGHSVLAAKLERYEQEDDHTMLFSWCSLSKYPPTALTIFTHMLVVAVALLFVHCRPQSNPHSITRVATFALKVAALVSINTILKYGKHIGVLLTHLPELQSISWVGGLNNNWPLALTLSLGFLFYFVYDIRQACLPSSQLAGKSLLAEAAGVPRTVTAASIYEDPSVPTVYCMQTFLLCCIFVLYYVTHIATPVKSTFFSRALWGASLFVQVYMGTKGWWFREDQDVTSSLKTLGRWLVRLDEQKNPGLWSALYQQAHLEAPDKAAPKLGKAEVLLRFTMSYVGNGLFQIITLYSLPHYLASCGAVSDFVLNAFAVSFIYQLDDLPNAQDYCVRCEEEEDGGSSSGSGSETEEGRA